MSQVEAGRVHVAAFEEVPQIDIGPMFQDDEPARRRVGDAVRGACIDVGFFYIRNHGVPQATADETFRQMALFFAQPEDAKREIHASKSRYFRGYSGLYEERHDATTDYYEPHEVIDFGRENEPDDPPECASSLLYGPNLWPSNPPALRRAVEAYYAAMLEVSNALLRAFALALALPESLLWRQVRPCRRRAQALALPAPAFGRDAARRRRAYGLRDLHHPGPGCQSRPSGL